MIRYVISHTGKKGGPWEADADTKFGEPTSDPQKRWAKPFPRIAHQICARLRRFGHPHAKVFRLVRRSRPSLTAEELAVVEAAVLLVECGAAAVGGSGALTSLAAKVRALRAKRVGK
jgi:hypothetical protein